MKIVKSNPVFPSNNLILLLSRTHYDDVLAALNEARCSGYSLFTACELLEEKLMADANAVRIGGLVPGKRYGFLGVSPNATAERNGRMIPNHGEIYLYSATYQETFDTNENVLVSETAWGAIREKMVRPGMLLVEL